MNHKYKFFSYIKILGLSNIMVVFDIIYKNIWIKTVDLI